VPINPPLILASSSPRRLALLRQAGIDPARLEAPQIDEAPAPREQPRAHALRLAHAKCACGRRILPKTVEAADAERCLRLLSGRRHRVYTGVVVSGPHGLAARVAMTLVRFKRLHDADLAWYLASEEWNGKAGGYAIQGRAEAFVVSLNGSWSNVVGLPLAMTLDLLRGLGWRLGA
jgi:septum formation protein